jgi:hypothetical protein
VGSPQQRTLQLSTQQVQKKEEHQLEHLSHLLRILMADQKQVLCET